MLTLVVVPVFYAILDRFKRHRRFELTEPDRVLTAVGHDAVDPTGT